MGFSLWNLFKAGLLGVNAIMVLNKQRFLSQYGLDDIVVASNDPLKSQVVGLLHAVQYLKVPVIVANMITIIFEIIFGG